MSTATVRPPGTAEKSSNATLISLQRKSPPVTDKDHISLLLPTRGRPQMLGEVFDSIEQTAAQKAKVAVWLYIDHDDQPTLDAIHGGQFGKYSFAIHWLVGDRTASLGELHNLTWQACTSGSGIFMLHADDTSFVTAGWDDIIRNAFNQYPDRILVAHPHEPELHEPTFQMILSAEWMAVTGYFSTAYFPFWFDDVWLDQIGQIIGRRAQLPIKLGLIGGKGKTMRMRNMAFWTSFYNHTLEERVQTAAKLRNVICPQPSPERERNEQEGQAVIQRFQAEKDNFSDLYALFREERHSSLDAAQRQKFDERYFNLEAKAVAMLLTKAQTCLQASQFAEAVSLLEVITHSDLHSSHVNYLKAAALHGLGKTAEAEKLERETGRQWPDNSLLRRIFRFVAYVFIEAKRMVYSKW
jgi:hypothetical protein